MTINGTVLDEPYLTDRALGSCNIEFPYQVPDGKYFCMGDHRGSSQDSRLSEIGAIADEYIIGKVAFRLWPLEALGGDGIDYKIEVPES